MPKHTQRPNEYRAWDNNTQKMYYVEDKDGGYLDYFPLRALLGHNNDFIWLQFTGLYDKNGRKIFEGDIVEFTDKWEWYRSKYGVDMMFARDKEEWQQLKAKYDAEPMHRFEVVFDPYEGYNLSGYDLGEKRYQVIGNIYENSDLLSA